MATSRNIQTPIDYTHPLYTSLSQNEMLLKDQFSENLPLYSGNPLIEVSDGVDMDVLALSSQADQFDDFGDNSRKESEILKMNRLKLLEYIHDCKVLFPFMKQCNVFNTHECEIIEHEVTGKQRMDKFIDIVLTRGPDAVGVFHEALRKDYPFVFDMLTRLFISSNIDLPPSRQLRVDSNESEPLSEVVTSESTFHTMRRKSPSIRQTIRKHIDELTLRCESVKSQRDELQQALLQRERDINALLSHRDQQIQQKYEDMLSLLANWRELMTHQSDGSIQKMQELLSEQESVKEAYEILEGEYMLVFSELRAARDRISKLLAHLEKMETEFSLAQEQKEELNDKILIQQGEIQRMERRFERLKLDPYSQNSVLELEVEQMKSPKQTAGLKCQLEEILEDRKECERMMKVVQLERKEAMKENEHLQLKLHEERVKRKKLEQEISKLQRPDLISPGICGYHSISEPGKMSSSVAPTYGNFAEDSLVQQTSKSVPLQSETIVMPVHEMGMELTLAVVVCELVDGGNAVKAGVHLGDEINEVNHIKISSDIEPLAFTHRLLQQASSTITLSIKRPAVSSFPHHSSSSLQFHNLAQNQFSLSSVGHPLTSKQVDVDSPIYSNVVHNAKKSLAGFVLGAGSRPLPQNLKSLVSNLSVASMPSKFNDGFRDTSDTASEDSNYDVNFIICDTECGSLNHSQVLPHLSQDGFITSPTVSLQYNFSSPHVPLMPLYDASTTSLPALDRVQAISSSLLSRCDSECANEPFHSLDDVQTIFKYPYNRPRHAMRKKAKGHRKKEQDAPKRLSRSLDDLVIVGDMLSSQTDLTSLSHNYIEDGTKQVILPYGQLGKGLSIIGGRGNGLYIHSVRFNERHLKTGDQIIQICGRLAARMTYAEAMELMAKYNSRGKESVLSVRPNMEGYMKLNLTSRDNFYVRAKVSHKSRIRPELSFELGDVFHVIDTKPYDQPDMWQVEMLNRRGKTISTGCIPVCIEWTGMAEPSSSQSLPRLIKNLGPFIGQKMESTLPISKPCPGEMTSTQCVFKLYQAVKELAVTECRPVVLFGVYESELSECLTTRNFKQKFAFPNREPKEKMAGITEDKIIETVHTKNDGVWQSTIDDVLEVTRSGHHCVLILSPNDMSKSRVSSLHPIIIALHPHSKTMKLKLVGGKLPKGFTHESISPAAVSQIKERVRRIQPYVTGEISLSSPINLEELVSKISDLVAVQQKNMLWELDIP